MANNVDLDELAHYEPSHRDLHCLHRYALVCRDERVKIKKTEVKVSFIFLEPGHTKKCA